MSKTTKIASLIYILVCISLFFFVRSIIGKETVKIREEKEKKIEEVYDVDVVFNYYEGNITKQYKETMRSKDTVLGFLDDLRKHKKLLFEKTDYTYGIEIDSVNKIEAPDGYKWSILENGEDITLNIGKINIRKDSTFELKLIKKL